MENYSIQVPFEARNTRRGRSSLDAELALCSETGLPEEAVGDARELLDAVDIDIDSEYNELPVLAYVGKDGRGKISLFDPREGYIQDAVLRDGARGLQDVGEFVLNGQKYVVFSAEDVDYSVPVRRAA
tara:strand:- start:3540 stop:3923 length:384 start_codon:yes stop_codon:yes gene_type:complete